MSRVLLDDIKVTGGTVAVGDLVKVAPSRPGHHDGFVATIRRITANALGDVEVDVFGGRPGHVAWRSFTPDRLRRVNRRAVHA